MAVWTGLSKDSCEELWGPSSRGLSTGPCQPQPLWGACGNGFLHQVQCRLTRTVTPRGAQPLVGPALSEVGGWGSR